MRELRTNLNPMQYAVSKSTIPEKMVVGGRGSGKTTVTAEEMERDVYEAPRSRIAVVGATYLQLLTLEIAPIKAHWERMGYHKDIHYFIGEKPPRKWRKKWTDAYFMPETVNYCIWWHTGTIFQLISFDRKDTGVRGGSFDRLNVVEAAIMPKQRLDTEVIPALRPTHEKLKKYKYQGGQTYTTTMPWTQQGQWIFQFEEQQNQEIRTILGNDDYNTYQEIKTQKDFKNPHWRRLTTKIRQKENATYYDKEEGRRKRVRNSLYIETTSQVNKFNLGDDYLGRMKRTLSPLVYDVEVMNKRLSLTPNSFYPKFKESIHCYTAINYHHLDAIEFNFDNYKADCRNDDDLVKGKHLEISLDFNADIFTLLSFQYLQSINTVKFQKSFFVKEGEELKTLINQYCDYYEPHNSKHVKIWGDRNGHFERDQNRNTYYNDVITEFKKRGWTVELCAPSKNIEHPLRYIIVNRMLSETSVKHSPLPSIQINEVNCKDLVIAIKATPAKKSDRIEKDKSSERNNEIPAEHATHFSDCFDYALYQFFEMAEFSANTEIFAMGITS